MKQMLYILLIWSAIQTCFAQAPMIEDPYLMGLVEEAMSHNADIRSTQLTIEQAETLLKSAKLSYLPTLSFEPSATLNKYVGGTATKEFHVPVTIGWELNLGGRQKATKEIARNQLEINKEQLRLIQIETTAAIATAYYTLIMLDRQVEITRQSIQNQEATLATILAYKEIGKMTELAINETEVALCENKGTLLDMEKQIETVESALSILINQQPNKIERSTWKDARDFPALPDSSISLERLSSRPDVQMAELTLHKACGNIKIAQSAFYPTLRISAQGGWTNLVGEMVNPKKLLLTLISSLVQPLFERGCLKTEKKIAITQRQQAEIGFEQALLKAGGEVKDALTACAYIHKKRLVTEKNLAAGKAAYENSLLLLENSQSITYLDLLTAHGSYLKAQLQEVEEWMAQQQANINLYKALCPKR